MPSILRIVVVGFCIAATAALAGCAGFESAGSGPAAEAPAYRVGDRWTYRVQDGFRSPERWEETHSITRNRRGGDQRADYAEGSVPRRRPRRAVVGTRPGEDRRRVRQRNAPLRHAARALPVPARRRQRSGASSSTTHNEATKTTGQINRYVRVRGWEKVTTPAGTFDALAMHVVMHLDDEEFWRYATQCNYTIWYAPAVRGVVRAEKRAQYLEKGGDFDSGGRIPTQNAVVELVSFTPGS